MVFNHRVLAMSRVMAEVQLAMIRARRQKNLFHPKSRDKEPQYASCLFS